MEEHRRELVAAARDEIELMTKSSADKFDEGKLRELLIEKSTVKSEKLDRDWVNSSARRVHGRNFAIETSQTSLNQTKPLIVVLPQLNI